MAENIKKVVRNGQVFNVPGSASDDQIDTYFRNKFGDSSRTWSHTAAMPGAPEAGAAPAGRSMRAAPTPGAMTAGMGGAPDLSFASMRKGGRPLPTEEDLRLAEVHRDIFRRQREQSAEMAEEFGTEDYKIGNFFANIGRGRQKLDYNPDAAAFSRAEAERFSDENWQRQYGGRALSDADRAKMRSEIEDYYRQRQGLRPENEALYGAGTGVGRGLINYGANVLENLSLGALDLGNFQSKISEEMALGSSAEAQAAKAAGVDISQFAPGGAARNLSQLAEGVGTGIGMSLMVGGLAKGAGKLMGGGAAPPAAQKLAESLSIARRGIGAAKKIAGGAALTGAASGLGAEPSYEIDPATGRPMIDPETGEPIMQSRGEAVLEAAGAGAYMGALGGTIASVLNRIPAKYLPGLGKAWKKDIIRYPVINAAGNYVTERYLRLDGSTPTNEELAQAVALGAIFGLNDWSEARLAKSKIPELRRIAQEERAKDYAARDVRAAQLPDIAAAEFGLNPDEVRQKIESKRRKEDNVLSARLIGDNAMDLAAVLDMDVKDLRDARARVAKEKIAAEKAAAAAQEAERVRLEAETKKAEVDAARVKTLVDTGDFTEDEARTLIAEQDAKKTEDTRFKAAAEAMGVTVAQYKKLREERVAAKEAARVKAEAEAAAKRDEADPEAARLRLSLRMQEAGFDRAEVEDFMSKFEEMSSRPEGEAPAGEPPAPKTPERAAAEMSVFDGLSDEALGSVQALIDAGQVKAQPRVQDPQTARDNRLKTSLFLQEQYGWSKEDADTFAEQFDVGNAANAPTAERMKTRTLPTRRTAVPTPPETALQGPEAPGRSILETPQSALYAERFPEAPTTLTPEQRAQAVAGGLSSAPPKPPPPTPPAPPAAGEGGAPAKPGPKPKTPPAAPKQAPAPAPAAAPAEPAPAPKRAGLGGRKKAVTTADEIEQARLREAEAEAEREAMRDVPVFEEEPEAVVEGAAATKKAAPKAKPTAAPPPAAQPKPKGARQAKADTAARIAAAATETAAPAAPKAPKVTAPKAAAPPKAPAKAAAPAAAARPDAKKIESVRSAPTIGAAGAEDLQVRTPSASAYEIAQSIVSKNPLGVDSGNRPARVMSNRYIARMMSGEFVPPAGGGEPNPEARIAANSINRLNIPGMTEKDAQRIATGGGSAQEYDIISQANKREILGAIAALDRSGRYLGKRLRRTLVKVIDSGNLDAAISKGLVSMREDFRQRVLLNLVDRSKGVRAKVSRIVLPEVIRSLRINNLSAGIMSAPKMTAIIENSAALADRYNAVRKSVMDKGVDSATAHDIASKAVLVDLSEYRMKAIREGRFVGSDAQREAFIAEYENNHQARVDEVKGLIENPSKIVAKTPAEALSAARAPESKISGMVETAAPAAEPRMAAGERGVLTPRTVLSPQDIREIRVSRGIGRVPGAAVSPLAKGDVSSMEPIGIPSRVVEGAVRGQRVASPETMAAVLEQAAAAMPTERGGLGTNRTSAAVLRGLAKAFREGTVPEFIKSGRERAGARFDNALRAGLNKADIEAEALRGEPRTEGPRGFRTPGNVVRRIEVEGEFGMSGAASPEEEFSGAAARDILTSTGTAKEVLTDTAVRRLIIDEPGTTAFAEKYGDIWGKAVERDALSRGYSDEDAAVIREHERLRTINENMIVTDSMGIDKRRGITTRKGRIEAMLKSLEKQLPDGWKAESEELYGDSRVYRPTPSPEGEAPVSRFVSDIEPARFGGVEGSMTEGMIPVPTGSQLALDLTSPGIPEPRRLELLATIRDRRAELKRSLRAGDISRGEYDRKIKSLNYFEASLRGKYAPNKKIAYYAGSMEDPRSVESIQDAMGETPVAPGQMSMEFKEGGKPKGIGRRARRDVSQMGAAYNPAALLFEAAVKGGKVLVEAVKRVFGAATDVGRQFMARVRAAKGDPAKIREAVDEAVKGVTPQPVADVTAEAVGETMSMAGRVKSVGGAVAARVGEMFKQTADETRRFEGELSVEERELMEASGGLFAAGRSFGPLNSPERQAAASLAEITPVPGTNYGESKFQQAIEGRYEGTLTPQEQRIVDAAIRLGARTLELAKGVGMLRLNRTTGKLEGYENVPAGREGMVFRNMPTQEMTEIISVGKAHTMWPELVDAIQQKNPGKSTGEIEEALMERHNALRQMGVSSSEKTSALEFFREFQMPAGLVRENGKVVPLFETNPSKWGKAMVRSSATRLGFVSVFGQDFAYNPDTMEIEPDLPSPIDIQKEEYSMSVDRRKRGLAEGYFDQARRVAEGRLLEPPSERETGVPQRAARLLIDFINSPIKTMKLSASPLYNALEPFGMAAEQAGYGNVFEAYSDAILSGLYNLTNGKFGSESAAKIFRNLERMGAMGVERVSSQRFVTGVAARAMELSVAKMKARKAGGPGADDDSARLVQMGYDQATANRLARGGGTDAEYDRLIRSAAPSATGGRMGAVEKSRLENTRWFKTWFPIATYATRQLQQFVRTAKMAYDTPKMSRLQAEAATKQILKMAGGRAASGTAQNLMFAFFIGGTAGLRAAWSALKDDPLDKIIEGATSSVFSGPYAGVAQNMMRGDDSIFKTIFPLAVVMEAGDLLTNGGRYENLEPGDKLVEATQWLIPAVKVVSGLGSTAMSILGDDDISREVKQVKSAYYRWAREEKIRRPFGGILNPTEADEAFARAMKRARRAIESRQPEKAAQYLREAMGVEGKDARSVATSLDRARVLKGLDENQLASLRRKIGEKNFQILTAEDDLIESIVKSFAGDRKKKAKVIMFPEGRVQSSFGLGRAR